MKSRVLSSVLSALLLAAPVFFQGCAGYRVGNIAGRELQGVKSVYVPVVKNQSFEPGIQVMATNAILRRFDNDGTLETTSNNRADSQLDVTILEMTRKNLRSVRNDVITTAQYDITLKAKITFTNRRTGKQVLKDVPVSGSTFYYVQSDMQEVERQALPLAAEDLANNIVKRITEGW